MKLSVLSAIVCLSALAAPGIATPTPFEGRAKPNKCGPSGAHANGAPNCRVTPSGVSCSSYTIGGVGNTNAVELLTATWSATVTCTNNGGKTVAVKTQFPSSPDQQSLTPNTNGQLAVGPLSVAEPTDADFEGQAKCPNANWSKMLQPGSIALSSFQYTLTFNGFSCPFISQPPL
jgi:hypothetical protein